VMLRRSAATGGGLSGLSEASILPHHSFPTPLKHGLASRRAGAAVQVGRRKQTTCRGSGMRFSDAESD
jgi:hypothetical protein